MKIFFLTTIIILSVSFIATAQNAGDVSTLSKSQGGQRILNYFAAFNSGDEQKLRTFFEENIAAESLKQRPVEPRLAFQKQVKDNLQAVEIKQVLSITETEAKVLAQAKTGKWVAYSFAFENQPSQKLLGLRLDDTSAPTDKKSPVDNSPLTRPEALKNVEGLFDELSKTDQFSGVVLIAQKDQPLFSKAYGLSDKEANVPNKIDTKFNLGSINKTFTRVAIGQLVQQGKISFDDTLAKFLPDYPNAEAAKKITIRHLITMTSGIGDFYGDKFLATSKQFRKNSDFIPLFAGQPLAFEPGAGNLYSNGGYILLGAVIEKVTGMSYYDYVRENIFKPAGMTETESFETDKLPVNTARGYTERNTKDRIINTSRLAARGSAAGGGYSTAIDLLKFSLCLQSGKLVIPDDNGQPQKEAALGIAGGSDGVNGLLLVSGRTGYTVIILSNYDPPSAEKPGEQVRDLLRRIKE